MELLCLVEPLQQGSVLGIVLRPVIEGRLVVVAAREYAGPAKTFQEFLEDQARRVMAWSATRVSG